MNSIEIEQVSTESLVPNPWNSNSVGPEMEQRLRASIEKLGFYKPVICRSVNGQLQILGGEHRWRVAVKMGLPTVPVVNLGEISDQKAKTIGLADNGRYGVDDLTRLTDVLRDIGLDEAAEMLPYSESDLAGMFAGGTGIDLSSIGFDDEEPGHEKTLDELMRPTQTHELMRFKVPIEDRERVQKLIEHVIGTRGLKAEDDSLVAAGMALVEIAIAAEGHL